jgi:CheY-like chemotaxis protein
VSVFFELASDSGGWDGLLGTEDQYDRMTEKIRTILIAEDSDDDFFLFRRAFSKETSPPRLQRAADGVDAIEYLAGENGYADRRVHPLPDLVVLDLKMPRKDGFEVLEWIRGQAKLQRLPVVILSASIQPDDVERAYSMGVNSFLTKPSSYDFYNDMLRVLREYWFNWNEPPVP